MWTIQVFNIIKKGWNWLIKQPILIYCLLGAIIYFQYIGNSKLRDDVKRLQVNQIALTTNQSLQQQMTLDEFKQTHIKEDSIVKLLGLKPKQLQNVIVNQYHYHTDSIITVPLTPNEDPYNILPDDDISISDDVTIDNMDSKDTLYFRAPIRCGEVRGRVIKNKTISITKVDVKDKLHTYLYGLKRKHQILFIKWGEWTISNVKTYSECMQDTISVEENVKIIK